MPTPNKPVAVLRAEGKSHRTKAELELREKNEAALSSGKPMQARKEVKKNKVARKEFDRVEELLRSIGKNDALVESVINRYCQIYAEIVDFEEKRAEFSNGITELQKAYEEDVEAHSVEDRVIPALDYFKVLASMESAILNIDKRIQEKRKMLLDIEKENIMTIAAQLRSIPKKVEDSEEDDPMAKLLSNRMRGA